MHFWMKSQESGVDAPWLATALVLLLVSCGPEKASVSADTSSRPTTPLASVDTVSETPGASGIPFRAVGNEPGWLLLVTDSMLTLRWDYDERRADLPNPLVSLIAGGRRITASRSTPGDSLRVVVDIQDTRCADGMSGQQFPVRVTVDVNGRTLTGCGGNPVELLYGGTWVVATLNGQPLLTGSHVTMEFSRENQMVGNASCNSYSAPFTVTAQGMQVAPPRATRMACGDAKDRQERAFLTLLAGTRHFLLDERGTLTVSDSAGANIVARRSGSR